MRAIPDNKKREDMEKILIVGAKKIIAKRRSVTMTLEELATASDCSLQSVRATTLNPMEIVDKIFAKYLEDINSLIKLYLAACHHADDIETGLKESVRFFCHLTKDDPVMYAIWKVAKLDPQLTATLLPSRRRTAQLFAEKVQSFRPHVDYDQLYNAALLLDKTVEHVATLVQDLPENEASKLINETETLIILRLKSFL